MQSFKTGTFYSSQKKKILQLSTRFFECELHVYITHKHKLSLIQMECVPHSACVCPHTDQLSAGHREPLGFTNMNNCQSKWHQELGD